MIELRQSKLLLILTILKVHCLMQNPDNFNIILLVVKPVENQV